jgi:hypothetical protein
VPQMCLTREEDRPCPKRVDEATPELIATIPALVTVHFSPRKTRDPPNARQDRSGDRLEETTIGFRTLREVGRLIRSQSP